MGQAPNDEGTSSGTSALSAGLGALLIDGKRFAEAKPNGNEPPNYACEGCAFVGSPRRCGMAVYGLAEAAFGGDCDERDVIYVEAPNAEIRGRPLADGPA